jgi:hypothetical protein
VVVGLAPRDFDAVALHRCRLAIGAGQRQRPRSGHQRDIAGLREDARRDLHRRLHCDERCQRDADGLFPATVLPGVGVSDASGS